MYVERIGRCHTLFSRIYFFPFYSTTIAFVEPGTSSGAVSAERQRHSHGNGTDDDQWNVYHADGRGNFGSVETYKRYNSRSDLCPDFRGHGRQRIVHHSSRVVSGYRLSA